MGRIERVSNNNYMAANIAAAHLANRIPDDAQINTDRRVERINSQAEKESLARQNRLAMNALHRDIVYGAEEDHRAVNINLNGREQRQTQGKTASFRNIQENFAKNVGMNRGVINKAARNIGSVLAKPHQAGNRVIREAA